MSEGCVRTVSTLQHVLTVTAAQITLIYLPRYSGLAYVTYLLYCIGLTLLSWVTTLAPMFMDSKQ